MRGNIVAKCWAMCSRDCGMSLPIRFPLEADCSSIVRETPSRLCDRHRILRRRRISVEAAIDWQMAVVDFQGQQTERCLIDASAGMPCGSVTSQLPAPGPSLI